MVVFPALEFCCCCGCRYPYMYMYIFCQCRASHSESLPAPGGGAALPLVYYHVTQGVTRSVDDVLGYFVWPEPGR